jgi:hypothetical protein
LNKDIEVKMVLATMGAPEREYAIRVKTNTIAGTALEIA